MLKTGLALIGLALLIAGFAGGIYYERELVVHGPEYEPIVIPPYEPRLHPTPADGANADLGPEAAERALVETLRDPDPFTRTERLAQQLAKFGPGDASVILPVLENRHLDLLNPDYALLMRFWAQHDWEAASRWAAVDSPASFRGTILYAAVEELAKRDPQAAVALMYEVDRVPNPYSAIGQIGLVRGWFDGGKPGLEGYIYDLGVGNVQQRAMAAFARRAIMRDGPDEIMRWAADLPGDDALFKTMVFRQLGSELAQLDPQAAVAWCEAVCDSPFGSSVRTLIAQRWAAQDGYAAMEWVEGAAPGIERDWAVKGALRGWWRERPDEFDAWLNRETQNGTHIERWLAPAVGDYPAAIVRDPERLQDALAWASRIEDPEQRWRATVTVARVWYKRDPEAADAWMAQSYLDEEGRAAARGDGRIARGAADESAEGSEGAQSEDAQGEGPEASEAPAPVVEDAS